jgi:2-desacetyl-2-hydroxyethyl bacteriochlorophyllide A dehydrogenase
MENRRLLFPQIQKVEWESFNLPSTPEPHHVHVKTLYSLVSVGTELALYTGSHIGFSLPNPPFPMMPQRPGYALVGNITAVGEGVADFTPGMSVMLEAPHGTAASIDVRQDQIVPLPANLNPSTGTLIRMADIALTSVRVAPLQLGDSVVVYGMGLVGLLAAQLYKLNGAHPVIGVDLLPNRLSTAEKFGITALNASNTDISKEVAKLTNNHGADVVVEATGNPSVVPLALDLVTKGGRVTLLGSTRGRVEIDVYSQVHRKGVQLIGAHESVIQLDTQTSKRWTKPRDLRLLADLFDKEMLQADGLISHTITPAELPDIYNTISENPQGYLGVLVNWQMDNQP